MKYYLKTEVKFKYKEIGEGRPIVILHGLMGQLSNFQGVINFFPKKGYKVVLPELPLYDLPLIKTKAVNFAKFISEFLEHKHYKDVIVVGNSLGGHIALLTQKLYAESLAGLGTIGSSGSYERSMVGSYVKRQR